MIMLRTEQKFSTYATDADTESRSDVCSLVNVGQRNEEIYYKRKATLVTKIDENIDIDDEVIQKNGDGGWRIISITIDITLFGQTITKQPVALIAIDLKSNIVRD